MALTMWSLSVVVVDQLRLITCLKDNNPLNSIYRALFVRRSAGRESAGVARAHGALNRISPARRGRGVTALLLLLGAVMLGR